MIRGASRGFFLSPQFILIMEYQVVEDCPREFARFLKIALFIN